MATRRTSNARQRVRAPAEDIFRGGGEMGRRLREIDWSQHPLGPPAKWPSSLQTAVQIMLNSRYPMFVWWGEELVNLYNDAYIAVLGQRHPTALAQPAREVWREIWKEVGPLAERVMREGDSVWREQLLLMMERHGYREETYFTFSYSPVPGPRGTVGGVTCTCTEETERVIEGRRLNLLRRLGAELATAKTETAVYATVQRQFATSAPDMPFALIYRFDDTGSRAHLTCAHGDALTPQLAPAAIDILDTTAAWPAGAMAEGADPVAVALAERGGAESAPQQALVTPISHVGGTRAAGFLVAGLNPYRPLDAAYRGFLLLLTGQVAAALTNVRALEDERRRAEGLAELDRAKSAFFSNVSHEFRTPLTLMLGPLRELLEAGSGDLRPATREQIEMAHRNGLRLLRLVNTLLDLSRLEAGRMAPVFEPLALGPLTEELAGVFRSVIERAGLSLTVTCDEPLPSVRADRDMWEKIVFNLLSNAYKFTFRGGVTVSVQGRGDEVVLTVRDTGTGIPASELPKLFSRFHRIQGAVSRTHEGSGIGLALVHELVQLHQGTLTVESELGQGSAFTVRLPATPPRKGAAASGNVPRVPRPELAEEAAGWAEDRREPETGTTSAAVSAHRQRHRILVADDNADMRVYLRRLLEPHHQVVSVSDGRAALERLKAEGADLVLADVMMPEMDGLQLVRAVRGEPELQSVPVILISARAGAEASTEAYDAEANDYLTKPFTPRELLSRVHAHLRLADLRRREQELSRQVARQLRHATMLGELSARISVLGQPDLIIQVALEQLGRHLDVDHCYFVETDGGSDARVRITDEWRRTANSPTMSGTHELAAFGDAAWRERVTRQLLAVPDVGNDALTRPFLAAYERLGVQAYCSAPLIREGQWVGVLAVACAQPREWRQDEGELLEHVAARVWPLVERARSETARRRSEQQLQAALAQMPAGVYTTDLSGRIQFFNAAAAELWGRQPETGREEWSGALRTFHADGRPMAPTEGPLALLLREGRVLRGAEVVVERADATRRHVLVYPEPMRDENGVVVGAVSMLLDVTEQKRRERNAALLGQLAQRLSLLGSDIEIIRESTRLLGEHLGGSRCYFAQSASGPGEVAVVEDWHTPDLTSIAGTYPSVAFGDNAWWEAYRSRPLIIEDVAADVRTQSFASAYAAIQVRSYALVPFVRDSEWVVSLAATDTRPRAWTEDELGLMEDVVARVWPLVERARTAAALRESEERFRNIADHSPFMIWVTDGRGHCYYLNRPWFDYTGQTPAAAVGTGWLQVVHPDDRAAAEERFFAAVATAQPFQTEYRIRRADGVYRWAIDAAQPRFGPAGEFLGFVGSVIDITERKESELSVQARAERLRLALAASNSGDWSWDAASDIVTLSPRAADIFGIAPGPVITWNALLALLDPQDAERSRRAVEQALATRMDYDIEYRIPRPSGGVSWVAARGRGVYGETGQLQGMLGVVQEINGRKRAEHALLEREQRMNRLMSLMPAGIYACDAQGRITFYNKRAVELWGREPLPNTLYQDFCRLFPAYRLDGSPHPLEERVMSVALRERRSFRDAEGILERPDGTRWVTSANIDVLHDADGRFAGTIGIFLDVTARKHAENLIAGQSRALQLLAADEPLESVLDELVQTAERNHDGLLGFVLLYDAKQNRLRHGAAPSLPPDYNRAVAGAVVHPNLGTCGASITRRELVITADIEHDPLWEEHRQLPLGQGLRAAWSMPIVGTEQVVLGTFGGYYRERREPSAAERATVTFLAGAAAIAIERHRAQEAVRAAEAQLRFITDNSPVMLTQCDAQRRFTFANRAYLERRGMKAADVIGRPIEDVVGPAAYPAIRPYIDLVMAGVRVDYEIELEYPRIGRRTLSVSHVPDRSVEGVVHGWVSALSDITEHKRADAATRQLAAIVESSEDAIISKDLNGIVTTWNRGAERLFGYTAAEMLGQSILRLLPPDRQQEEPRIVSNLRDGQLVDHLETVRLHKDGHLIDVSLTISPIRDAQGRTIGASKIARDITQRKRQEVELRRREQLYRAIGESIDYGIWVCDASGRNVYCSESFLRLIGQTMEECSGTGWGRALHPDQREATFAAWAECVRTGGFWEREHLFKGVDGEWHPILARGVPIRDDRGQITSWAGINLDVSAYKRAEEAMRQSEARFREIADNIPLFAWMAQPDGRIYWFNQRWTAYTGIALEEATADSPQLAVHPDHVERVRERYVKAFQAGQVWEDTFPLRSHDGSYRWFLSRAVPIRDEQERILRWFGTNTDITDLREAQEVLAERTGTLETLNRVGNALVAELDLERIVQIVTDAGREISGARVGAFHYHLVNEQGEQRSWFTVSGGPPALGERLRQWQGSEAIRSSLRRQDVIRIANLETEARFQRPGGAARPSGPESLRSFLAVPVVSRTGDVLGGLYLAHPAAAVFTEDVEHSLTALAAQAAIAIDNANLYAALQRELALQKRADAALRASENQLRLVTDHATVHLVLIDRSHRYKFANRAYAQRFDREPPELVGLHLQEVEGEEAYAASIRHLEAAFAGQRVDREIELAYRDAGSRWMHVVYVPERAPDGAVIGLLAVMNDITARKQAEREIEVARDRALAASRAKDDFLAALSHELRTPLNPVLLLASEAAEDPTLAPEVRETFSTIRNNVELEARLIDDLLDLTRISRGKLPLDMRVIDVHPVIESALATVRGEVEEKGLELTLQLAPGPAEVYGDVVRLQQIFWNVLKNAVKFTPARGRITVTSECGADGWLLVRVADTGIGLTPRELERIFDAFVQGDHAGSGGSHRFGGVGLGLAISQMLVEQHQGRIRAESAGRDRGATFLIELPLTGAVRRSPTVPPSIGRNRTEIITPELTGPVVGPTARVLLVEDHEPTRLTLTQVLTRRGYVVQCAATVAEARALAREQTFDLLISDIGLPDGNGYDLMAALAAEQGVPGIALSGYGMEEDIARSQRAGFLQHLTKPVRVQLLDRALAQIRDPNPPRQPEPTSEPTNVGG